MYSYPALYGAWQFTGVISCHLRLLDYQVVEFYMLFLLSLFSSEIPEIYKVLILAFTAIESFCVLKRPNTPYRLRTRSTGSVFPSSSAPQPPTWKALIFEAHYPGLCDILSSSLSWYSHVYTHPGNIFIERTVLYEFQFAKTYQKRCKRHPHPASHTLDFKLILRLSGSHFRTSVSVNQRLHFQAHSQP